MVGEKRSNLEQGQMKYEKGCDKLRMIKNDLEPDCKQRVETSTAGSRLAAMSIDDKLLEPNIVRQMGLKIGNSSNECCLVPEQCFGQEQCSLKSSLLLLFAWWKRGHNLSSCSCCHYLDRVAFSADGLQQAAGGGQICCHRNSMPSNMTDMVPITDTKPASANGKPWKGAHTERRQHRPIFTQRPPSSQSSSPPLGVHIRLGSHNNNKTTNGNALGLGAANCLLYSLALVLLLSSSQLGQLVHRVREHGSHFAQVTAAPSAAEGTTTTTSRLYKLVYPQSDPRLGCNYLGKSGAESVVCMLKFDLKPLVEHYKVAYANSLASSDEVRQLLELAPIIDGLQEGAKTALDQADFCSFSTISHLEELGKTMHQNHLLDLAYDLIVIEFHKRCLEATLNKLPPVPYDIKDVVQIYISGADKSLPDLNLEPGESESGRKEDLLDEVESFDVDQAIRDNGSLEEVVGLTLHTSLGSSSNHELAEKFVRSCRNYLAEIENRWQPMEMMNKMLDSAGSSIKSLNNYIMRKSLPTMYADICSQISLRHENAASSSRG